MMDTILGALDLMRRGPKDLAACLRASAEINDDSATSLETVFNHLRTAPLPDPILAVFRQRLAAWDNEEGSGWSAHSNRNSTERRSAIYAALSLGESHRAVCSDRFPPYQIESPVVIADSHRLWYDSDIWDSRGLYWNAYVRHLRETHRWPEQSILQLDESTRGIVARVANPLASDAYQSKGLVVGYVQSGKTANFAGVIAKAVDAGYRLIIVLGGTLDVLRSQTQRRLDKDLIGCELLGDEYVNDDDYGSFIRHGNAPSLLGASDILRLTGPDSDYKSLGHGLEALAFEKHDPSKPFFSAENALRAKVRVAVVKKHPSILGKLISDLKKAAKRPGAVPLDQVATLIIDDESDQASLNTRRQEELDDEKKKARTSTNEAIVDLLKLLPRAQYLGYTATPFANVFVDPDDPLDIFPKDFVVSLPRPDGYMGVRDFYDLDGDPELQESCPNRNDFVRDVEGADDAPENLRRAVDSFVLSGAIKLYRSEQSPDLRFRHHTMLVHSSSKTVDHTAMAIIVRKLYKNSGYDAGPGVARLRSLFTDFAQVHARRGATLPIPPSFDVLMPFVGRCLAKINTVCLRPESGRGEDDPGAVLVVNNNNRDQTPDFDRQEIWKILVGGTKLSRGYTIEGLTISYYRRLSHTADTLMQMGRWFGYRRGYQDLVRLFIGTAEPLNKNGSRILNLYEAFGAVCRDEEFFRDELKRYASLVEPRIRPIDIPPLVPSHMLKPTAKNKMYNAFIQSRNFGGRLVEQTQAPVRSDAKRKNIQLLGDLLKAGGVRPVELAAGQRKLKALIALPPKKKTLDFLKGYAWLEGNPLKPALEYIEGKYGDPGIDRWIVLAPQITDRSNAPSKSATIAGQSLGIFNRTRDTASRLNTYNTLPHRSFAQHLTGKVPMLAMNAELAGLTRPGQGVLLTYLISESKELDDATLTVGFTLLFPENGSIPPITFGVRDPTNPDVAIIDAIKKR